jgi:hypothetical protein
MFLKKQAKSGFLLLKGTVAGDGSFDHIIVSKI